MTNKLDESVRIMLDLWISMLPRIEHLMHKVNFELNFHDLAGLDSRLSELSNEVARTTRYAMSQLLEKKNDK